MIAGPSNAGSTDYAIKYNTWELVAIPNPTRFDQNTPAKLFFMRMLPVAEGLKLRQGARGCIGRDIPEANGISIGVGHLNTDYMLVAGCGDTSAAALASNYRGPNGDTDGWFLPSRAELNLLVQDRNVNVAPGFYWTSSEIGAGPAWMQYFPVGGQFSEEKSRTGGVLAVRSF